MIYLASPYSHPDPAVMAERYRRVEDVTALLMTRGKFVWSPIVQTHHMNDRHQLPTDADFWRAYNFDFMRHASDIYVLTMLGWRESRGVKMEMEFAHYVGVPLTLINEKGEFHE